MKLILPKFKEKIKIPKSYKIKEKESLVTDFL